MEIDLCMVESIFDRFRPVVSHPERESAAMPRERITFRHQALIVYALAPSELFTRHALKLDVGRRHLSHVLMIIFYPSQASRETLPYSQARNFQGKPSKYLVSEAIPAL